MLPFSLGLTLFLAICRLAESSWWLLAIPSAHHNALSMSKNYKDDCRNMDYLMKRQRELCEISQNMLSVVSEGAQMGLKECQHQFSGSHWNCSTQFDHLDLPDLPIRKSPKKITSKLIATKKGAWKKPMEMMQGDSPIPDVQDVFGESLKYQSREKAYVHAISASGVTYSVTRACSQGILSSCSCDRTVHRRRAKQAKNWEWGGCSEDLGYGERLSKEFVDSNDLEAHLKDPAARLMNLHNNEAGRKAVRRNMELACKCHGVSGSCTTKICWRKMKDFREIGQHLYKKFASAVRVKFNKKRFKLKTLSHDEDEEESSRRPKRRDLVYLQDSPDYCTEDPKAGISGTRGRQCNETGFDTSSCQVLCCGRGYWTKTIEKEVDCDCQFVWCCEVKCRKCKTTERLHFCK